MSTLGLRSSLRLSAPAVASIVASSLLLVAACDPGSKSVSGTADEAGDDGNSSASDDGSDDGDIADPNDGGGATSQGPGEGGDDGSSGEPQCLETETVITDTVAVNALGFSADDIIALSNGWSMDLHWLPNDGPTSIVPAGTTVPLDIGMSYAGGEIRFIESEQNPNSPFDIISECDDRLEIDLELTFSTTDGRFAETFGAVGTATSGERVGVERYFEPDEFMGSFSDAEVSFSDGEGEVTRFAIFANMSDAALPEGSVNVEVLIPFGDDPDESLAGFGVIATFPEPLGGE